MVLLNINSPSVSGNLVTEIDEELIDEIGCPPTDLCSDEPELESDLHREQIDLLIRLLKYHWQPNCLLQRAATQNKGFS